MPIAYNINLMVADKGGHAALIESFNGKIAVRQINADSKNQFIASTNHVHLPELQGYAPLSMQNSLVRYKLINDKLEGNKLFGREDLKQFLSDQYPVGLCCHYYDDFFGTLHSMVFDVNEGAVDVCFGSPDTNAWHTFCVFDEVLRAEYPVELSKARAPKGFYDMIASEEKESGDKD
jgi:hypothetical protein